MIERLSKSLIIALSLCVCSGNLGFHLPVGANETKAPEQGDEKPFGYYTTPILDAVNADENQRKKITAIVEELRPVIEPLKKKFKEKQSAFLGGMSSGATAEDLLTSQRELGRIRGEINDQYLLLRLRIRKVLQPQQMALYDDFLVKQGWRHKDQK